MKEKEQEQEKALDGEYKMKKTIASAVLFLGLGLTSFGSHQLSTGQKDSNVPKKTYTIDESEAVIPSRLQREQYIIGYNRKR